MDAMPSGLSSRTLLEHESFVQAVARGLLGDPEQARDVAQDTWLQALRGGPRSLPSLRAWLGRVAGHRALDVRRAASRRTARERSVARDEALEPVDVTYERLATQREVVAKILELSEPYKSVVILRYYHELTHEQIAARLHSKPATVRTQLVRAHETLRSKLDAQYRDRETWSALLLPFAAPPVQFVATKALLVAACAVVVSAASVGWWTSRGEGAHPATPLATARAAAAPEPVAGQREEVPAAAQQSQTPPIRTVAPPRRAAAEVVSARAELLDRRKYDDYEKATFSFEYALRDDPLKKTHNDWDLEFTDTSFQVDTVVSDNSTIVDLGARHLVEVGAAPEEDLAAAVLAVAQRNEVRRFAESRREKPTPCIAGHTYFVWTNDDDTDLSTCFEVVELEAGDRCVLEWYSTGDGRIAQCSVADPHTARSLADTLLALRNVVRSARPMPASRIVLQVRSGATSSGNPNRIDVAGDAFAYVDRLSSTPVDLAVPPAPDDRSLAYSSGGYIPEGMVWIVRRVTYSGEVPRDGAPRGGFKLVLHGETIVDRETADAPIRGEWTGTLALAAGDERATYLELRNQSAGEVVLEGAFEPRKR
jgi:RNA polymerase sigma-70 factor (ECF subfamily)